MERLNVRQASLPLLRASARFPLAGSLAGRQEEEEPFENFPLVRIAPALAKRALGGLDSLLTHTLSTGRLGRRAR